MLELSHEDNSRFWHLVGVSWHARLLHLSVSSGVRIKDYVSIPFVVDPGLIFVSMIVVASESGNTTRCNKLYIAICLFPS
jgi:hypothetical protein